MTYHETKSGVLYCGDVLATLRSLPDEIVNCCVTSPPYWGLRDYGTATWVGGDAECSHKTGRFEYSVSKMQAGNNGSAGHQARDKCPKCGAIRKDLNPEYCEIAKRRIDAELEQTEIDL